MSLGCQDTVITLSSCEDAELVMASKQESEVMGCDAEVALQGWTGEGENGGWKTS